MSTGSAWNPKLQCKNSLAWALTIINASTASFILEVRKALAEQTHQKFILQLPERERFMEAASESQAQQGQVSLQSKTPTSGQVRWKVMQHYQSWSCTWRRLRFWVTFSLGEVLLRCKKLPPWFILSAGSAAFVGLSRWSIGATRFVWAIDAGQCRYCRLGLCGYVCVNIIVM